MAGDVVRRARADAGGLSQAELARRSGVPRTVIVEVERGRRQPSLPTLGRMVQGAGFRLKVGLERSEPSWPRLAPGDEAAARQRARAVLDALLLADAIRLGRQEQRGRLRGA